MSGCILLKFYIKPQPDEIKPFGVEVVSYWNSTSNHNYGWRRRRQAQVVSYWNSTSNHNGQQPPLAEQQLYLIEILHQTTTRPLVVYWYVLLYLIEILHQTTTNRNDVDLRRGCILLKFYIKPQPWIATAIILLSCILLKFYIKPQHRFIHLRAVSSCILLKFYIKPQLYLWAACAWFCCILLKFYIKPQHNIQTLNTL